MKRKKRGKKHLPGYLAGMIGVGILLNVFLLPALGYLYYGGVVEAGVLDEIPCHVDASQPEEQRLYVVKGNEACTVQIPVTGETILSEEVAARKIRLSIDPGVVQDTERLTITADTDCLASAALYRSGRVLEFELTLSSEMRAVLSQTPEGQRIELKPMTAGAENGILLDVRGAEAQNAAAMRLAELVLERFPAEEENAAVIYLIGNETEPLTDADYAAFIVECDPEIYLKIREGAEDAGYALCNPRFFLPGLDSVVLATTLLKNMAGKTGEATPGVREADGTDPLRGFTIPAAELVLADTTVMTEEARSVYLEAAADGIVQGLIEALSVKE